MNDDTKKGAVKRLALAITHELHAYDDDDANALFAELVNSMRRSGAPMLKALAGAVETNYAIAFNDAILTADY